MVIYNKNGNLYKQKYASKIKTKNEFKQNSGYLILEVLEIFSEGFENNNTIIILEMLLN